MINKMKYLTLGIHYPKPEHKQDILDITQKIAEAARSESGLIDTGAWLDETNDRIIILTLWESEEFANKARPNLAPLVANIPFNDWERKPTERLVNLKRVL